MTPFAFAFGAGLLATVNPCGFAMLPAFLTYYLAGDVAEASEATANPPLVLRLAQGFGVGAAVSAGFAGVFVSAGLLVAAGLRVLLPYVPWVAVVIGAAMAGLGVAMVAGRHVGLRSARRLAPGQGRGYRRVVAFGGAYAMCSMSCTLPVLLAVVGQALATANPVRMVGVLAAYGAGAATVLTALSVSAALAKQAMARWIRHLLPVVGRLGGLLLAASGIYLVAFWLPVLVGHLPNRQLSGASSGYATRLAVFFDNHQALFEKLAVVLVVAGVAVALGAIRRKVADDKPDPQECCSAQPDEAGALAIADHRVGEHP